MNAEALLIGLIITLVLSGYGYTYMTGRDLRKEVRAIWTRLNNHYEHRLHDVEHRLARLEQPDKVNNER